MQLVRRVRWKALVTSVSIVVVRVHRLGRVYPPIRFAVVLGPERAARQAGIALCSRRRDKTYPGDAALDLT